MRRQDSWVVVGLDNGGNKNNATVLDPSKGFLVERLVETPSRVQEGPEVAIAALLDAFDGKRPPRIINPEVWPDYAKRFERAFGVRPA